MFNDFEKAKTEMPAGADAKGMPGMNDADLDNFEKQFTGMFSNIVKQMENLDDDDEDDEDEDLTEEEKREAENMMKNLFGAMGVDPSAAGGQGGMPGMGMPGMPGMGGAGGAPQQDFSA